MAGLVQRLAGKVALITGGASGIGECTARLFSLHGAKVVVADIQDDLGRSVCRDISATFVHCNVTDEDDVRNAIDAVVAQYGRLDIMYNNAGVLDGPSPIASTDMSDFDRVMQVIVRGTFLGTKHAARVMVPAGRGGSIISTASTASVIAGTATHAYTCAKHAVLGLTKSAAAELGRYGIRVNCVSPFGLATPMSTGYGMVAAETVEEMLKEHANLKGVVLKAADVAQAALYLVSDESRYVSGHNLLVDGGYSIVNPSLQVFNSQAIAGERDPRTT